LMLRIFLIFSLNYFCLNIHCSSQSNFTNKYGLVVIKSIDSFKSSISVDTNKRMVNILNCLPGIFLDLRYATTNNFLGRKLYPQIPTTYIRLAAAAALAKVVTDLNVAGLTIKIFDAYRPYSVTEEMWEAVKDARYAADPAKGSGHNRGIAVDLTLVNIKTGEELLMGTDFDNFSDTAHTDFSNLPDQVLENRKKLQRVMEKCGFVSLDTEWWHFSLPDAQHYELLDLTFNVLSKLNNKKIK
ncbi:MAG: M15 family metallopeptidase, partial [Ginsengibacter sp.]